METLDIAFVSPGFRKAEGYPDVSTGIEYQIYGLARALAKRGHRVRIYRRWSESGILSVGVELLGVRVGDLHDGALAEVPSRLLFSKRVQSRLLKDVPDIVHLVELFSGLFPGMSDELVRIYSTHNPDAMRFYRSFARQYNRANLLAFDVKRVLEERLISSADAVFALNLDLQRHVMEVGARRAVVVPNGIQTSLYANQGEDCNVLYAGKIDEVKGIDLLIQAYALLKPKGHLRLRIVGRGRLESAMRSLAERLNVAQSVDFIPWTDRETLRRYMSQCRIFVLPSRYETFGNVLLEAMACGKPVIATATMGSSSIVESGINGLLVQPGDVAALAEAMTTLASDEKLRHTLGRAARRRAEQAFEFSRVGALAESEYRRTLASSSRTMRSQTAPS